MSDIGGIFSLFDLVILAMIAGVPGILPGGLIGALLWRERRLAGAALGAVLGFAASLAAAILWVLVLK